MKFFLPKQKIFFDLFKELNVILQEMVQLFGEFSDSFNDFENYSKRAKAIEHRADDRTHEIVTMLNKTFVTPFDREDIYMLTNELDDIVDLIENVIQNINIYQIREKKVVVSEFAKLIAESSDNLNSLMNHFQEQKHSSRFNDFKVKIHELEDKGDLVFQQALKALFAEEKDPIKVIKWKDILENLEKVMDKFQSVSNTIEGIIVKSS